MYGLIEVVKAYTAVTAVYGLIFTGTKISGRVRPYPAVVVNPHTAATVVYGLTFTGINMLQRSGRVRPYPASGPTQIAKHLGRLRPQFGPLSNNQLYGRVRPIGQDMSDYSEDTQPLPAGAFNLLHVLDQTVRIQTKVD
ncbi:hypothetical protein BC829DRAFT_420246 [Chytridium lagenaria]|nr:hypothetical protein BC829DRAFT_420246 [Chytridium lagenaria]